MAAMSCVFLSQAKRNFLQGRQEGFCRVIANDSRIFQGLDLSECLGTEALDRTVMLSALAY